MSKIVDRTLDCLEVYGRERRPLTLSDVARLLKLPTSSCHDVLNTLLARGYVYQLTPRGAYYPTVRLHELGKTVTEFDPIIMRAELAARQLRDELEESVLLAKAHGLGATYLLVYESSSPLRFQGKAGDSLRALHATSAGKALLGSLNTKDLDAYLKSATLTPLTPHTVRSKTVLRKEIITSEKNGWFLNDCESVDGVMTLSARFVWGKSIYILTIAGPVNRVKQNQKRAVSLLLKACRDLEMASGI